VSNARAGWRNTTHDWARDLDAGHLQHIREEPTATGAGTAVVTMHPDRSTGTTVHFLPDAALISGTRIPARELRQLAGTFGPRLAVEVIGE